MIDSLKCAVGFVSSSQIIMDRSEPYRNQFSILKKAAQFSPLECKKLTPWYFVENESQIVEYGLAVVGIE